MNGSFGKLNFAHEAAIVAESHDPRGLRADSQKVPFIVKTHPRSLDKLSLVIRLLNTFINKLFKYIKIKLISIIIRVLKAGK